MVYGMGPKDTAAAIEAIESNIPDGSKPKIEAPTFPELFDKIVTAALEMRDAVEQTTEVADDPAGEWTPNFWHCGPPLFTGVPPCGQVPLG